MEKNIQQKTKSKNRMFNCTKQKRKTNDLKIPGGGEYSEFQVTGMIEWGQKLTCQKIPRTSGQQKPKGPWTKITIKNWLYFIRRTMCSGGGHKGLHC